MPPPYPKPNKIFCILFGNSPLCSKCNPNNEAKPLNSHLPPKWNGIFRPNRKNPALGNCNHSVQWELFFKNYTTSMVSLSICIQNNHVPQIMPVNMTAESSKKIIVCFLMNLILSHSEPLSGQGITSVTCHCKFKKQADFSHLFH